MSETDQRIRHELADLLGEAAFARVDRELREPNLFGILGAEERSSGINSFLAWLLNPNAGHGLEDAFLRAFLAEAIQHPPPDRDQAPEGLSPIPYEAVGERLLDWDLMDVRTADLRETDVRTDFHLSTSDARVDICLWNDAYRFAVYIENRLAPRDAWRQSQSGLGRPWEFRTEEYLLDLYHQWAVEEAGGYDILQVFLSLDEIQPGETRVVRSLGYTWMVDVLERLEQVPTASEHARMLLRDFRRWLRREIPGQLDRKGMYRDLVFLAENYAFVIARLFDHVAEHLGEDEEDSDEAAAFTEVYRRHKPTIDTLWRFVLNQEDERVGEICEEVEQLLTGEDGVVLMVLPNRLVATSPRWTLAGDRDGQPAVEVYASTTAASCGVLAYSRLLGTRAEELWRRAMEVAEGRGEALSSQKHAKLNFHLAKSLYEDWTPTQVGADFVRYCRFLNEIFSR